jgi:streptogramin lyase
MVACGGGGGGGGSVVAPPKPAATTPGSVPGQTAAVSFKIVLSGSGSSASARKPAFVSPATQSVVIALQGAAAPLATINLTSSAGNCTTTTSGTSCTVTVQAPVGQDTFVITCFDGLNGNGNQLSTATVAATVAANAQNTLGFTLNGVVASTAVILGSTSVPVGAPATVAVTVIGYDASGNIIIGPGNYSSPITLTDSDTSGVTTLSTTRVLAPGTNVNLVYTGGSLAGATITPSLNGTNGTPQTFAPAGTTYATYTLPASLSGGTIDVMAAGPDGNTWFTQFGVIGSISPAGNVNGYTVPSNDMFGLTAGTDGLMYFGDDSGLIGSISTTGASQQYLQVNAPSAGCPVAAAYLRKSAGSFTRGANAYACSFINWMLTGPDGYVWFVDGSGSIGSIAPNSGIANEFDITQLPGWPGGSSSPLQMTVGADGALYIGDMAGYIDRITIAAGTPTGVTQLALPMCAPGPIAMGNDGNIWFSDNCNNLGAVPNANFTSSAVTLFNMNGLTGSNNIYMMASSPGGVWFVLNPFRNPSSSVYRVSNVNGTAIPVPQITQVQLAAGTALVGSVALGQNKNIWAANLCPEPNMVSKIIYGAPPIGTQSTLRAGASKQVRVPAGRRFQRQIAGCSIANPSSTPGL